MFKKTWKMNNGSLQAFFKCYLNMKLQIKTDVSVTITLISKDLFHSYFHLERAMSRLLSFGKGCVTIIVIWKGLCHDYCHLERTMSRLLSF
jgi:hypothetical protein